jgi:hypothetical protein
MEICSRQTPPSFEVGAGHEAACWLHAPASDGRMQAAASSPDSKAGRSLPIQTKGVKEAKPP